MTFSLPSDLPSAFGREAVHHNDVLANRAKARRLWRMLSRRLSGPHFGR